MRKAASTRLPYKPGPNGEYRPVTQSETMPAHAFAYLNTWAMNVRIAAALKDADGTFGEGITLTISKGAKTRPLHIPLGELTELELEEARKFFNAAFDAALPIVKAKDQAAHDAWNIDGDDTYFRQYRVPPNVAFRNGPLAEYVESCVERSLYVPVAERERVDQPSGDGTDGDAVAPGDEADEVSGHSS